jgi:polyhydroxybutyrate depolymerase
LKALHLRSFLVVFVLAFALGGCARSTQANTATDTIGDIAVGGMQRTYLLHLPSGYQSAQPAPLLIALHGNGETGGGMAELTGFDDLADAQGFVVVYPDGIEKSWADRNNTDADRAGVDDVAFISALIDQLAVQYAIDPARVYATGMSNGGFMATVLACALPDKVAAVAPVAATMPASLVGDCPAGRPVPFLLIHGLDDTVVPPGGGMVQAQGGNLGPVLSDGDTAAFWANRDGCGAAPAVTRLPRPVDDGTRVRQMDYTGCQENAEVVYDAVVGAGHVWPGGPQDPPTNLDASAVIWSFFAAHPRQGSAADKPTDSR